MTMGGSRRDEELCKVVTKMEILVTCRQVARDKIVYLACE